MKANFKPRSTFIDLTVDLCQATWNSGSKQDLNSCPGIEPGQPDENKKSLKPDQQGLEARTYFSLETANTGCSVGGGVRVETQHTGFFREDILKIDKAVVEFIL